MTFVSRPNDGTWGDGSEQVTSRPAPPSCREQHGTWHGLPGGRLQLSNLQPDQAGTYTCVAENTQAEARKNFVVAVLGTSAP